MARFVLLVCLVSAALPVAGLAQTSAEDAWAHVHRMGFPIFRASGTIGR